MTQRKKIVAIMFTSLIKYQDLVKKDEKLAMEILNEHDFLLEKIINKNEGNIIKHINLIVVLVLFSNCDIEYPEQWESPTWEMPLTIPLIDQVYSVSDISTNDNQIEIDTLSQTFIISVDTTLLDSGEIKIEESFFSIPDS